MLKHSLKKGLIALSLAACFALPLQAKIVTDVAVSYTHLDVYKRQVFGLAMALLISYSNKWPKAGEHSQPHYSLLFH